ncbi:uncharacterized protein LOC127833420 isoform X2 [Dreissena polymorpha]|uniref:uncharacterized protein LOC127833420 isoform X2 n=1 Tax=Dreissena polymorpha TaxID=45954 RepID=UPI002263E5EB|nr:uncharacterized protein LOC127833420 isoform X2 [Dreissena polymorpha]
MLMKTAPSSREIGSSHILKMTAFLPEPPLRLPPLCAGRKPETSSDTSFSDEEAMRSSGGNMAQDSSRNVSDMETEPTVDQNEFMGDESLEDPGEYHSFQMQEGKQVSSPQSSSTPATVSIMTSAGPVQGGQSQSVQLKQQQLQQQQAIVAHQQAQLQSSQTQLQPETQETSSDTSFSDEEAMRSSGGNMAQDSSRNVSDIETEPTVDQNEFMGDESLEDPGEYHSFQMQEGKQVSSPQSSSTPATVSIMTSAGPVQGGQSQSVQLKQQQLQEQQAIVAHQQAQLQSSQTQLQPETQVPATTKRRHWELEVIDTSCVTEEEDQILFF